MHFLPIQGKPTESTKELKVLKYGERDTKDFIEGTEALPDSKAEGVRRVDEEGWESCSEEEGEEDSEGEWVDVHHSSDEEQVSLYCSNNCKPVFFHK